MSTPKKSYMQVTNCSLTLLGNLRQKEAHLIARVMNRSTINLGLN